MHASIGLISGIGVTTILCTMFVIVFVCARKAVQEMGFFGGGRRLGRFVLRGLAFDPGACQILRILRGGGCPRSRTEKDRGLARCRSAAVRGSRGDDPSGIAPARCGQSGSWQGTTASLEASKKREDRYEAAPGEGPQTLVPNGTRINRGKADQGQEEHGDEEVP